MGLFVEANKTICFETESLALSFSLVTVEKSEQAFGFAFNLLINSYKMKPRFLSLLRALIAL